MKNKEKLLIDLRQERDSINNKIHRLILFRTKHFMELDSNHLCLLDIQLNVMRTYSETLSARIVLVEGGLDENN